MEFKDSDFVRNYFGTVLELLSEHDSMESGEFYKTLADRMHMSCDDLMHIHHAFHWTLFIDNHTFPCTLDQGRVNHQMYFSVPEQYSREQLSRDIAELTDFCLWSYRDYVSDRLDSVRVSIPITS